MKVTVFYVGSSLLAPLREAERGINRDHALGLELAAHNLGAPLDDEAWRAAEGDLRGSELVFVFHVTDGENASRLIRLLETHDATLRAVVVINCMPDLMRRTRMGKLSFGVEGREADPGETRREGKARGLARGVAAWMGEQVKSARAKRGPRHTQYLKLVERLPALLKLVPPAGRLRDAKHYLQLFCYFLQPTPANVRAMLLYAAKHYAPRPALDRIKVAAPEAMPAVGVYHPDAPALFETYEKFRAWYERRGGRGRGPTLDPSRTVGLLLMRTHVVSGACAHYDELIRAVEREGLAVVPAISTFMDNREACERFFVERGGDGARRARVSQIVSLTGFSFVGGPAMNDSEAAVEFLKGLDVPFRSAVSLDVQTVEAWGDSWTGLNPVQAGMQVAIPEIDGATEPFVFGGMTAAGDAPVALAERCERLARRLRRWNDLRTAKPADVRLAFVIFCFPPSRGNVGTAAELDVFESLRETFARLKSEGYDVEVPATADELRERILGAGAGDFYGQPARVEYRMGADEYARLCPYAREIEREWGAAPGAINSFGDDLLILGARFGNALVAVQPTFGYEGDPMRLLMARGGAPHHGFAALYTYVEKVFRASAVVHVGTHGALEFMPGKQVGLSGECWPDRLIGELPHVYLYSVNNPSEGSIARRRSYAELVSYLTPNVSDAGLYAGLASLKEEIAAYRQAADERERERLYEAIEAKAAALHFDESL
ncbi:MAG TPA: cobaltochelatase subunit CobN [Pyrinomonadaceae bacterium]|nr:cobaltochelatase subunit CobN [Pyrinomonadaceae bacterium]